MDKEKHLCIICSQSIGKDGYLGTIKNISVAFCKEHAESCEENCEECVQAKKCPVCSGRNI